MKEEERVEVVVVVAVVVVVITTECVHRRIGQQETGNFREISEARQEKEECLAPFSDLYFFYSHQSLKFRDILFLFSVIFFLHGISMPSFKLFYPYGFKHSPLFLLC
jgi:hypothetical protein